MSNLTCATKTNDTPRLASFPEVFLVKKSAPDMMWESHSYVDRVCQDTLHNTKSTQAKQSYLKLKAQILKCSSIEN